jgi:hypothetical protein
VRGLGDAGGHLFTEPATLRNPRTALCKTLMFDRANASAAGTGASGFQRSEVAGSWAAGSTSTAYVSSGVPWSSGASQATVSEYGVARESSGASTRSGGAGCAQEPATLRRPRAVLCNTLMRASASAAGCSAYLGAERRGGRGEGRLAERVGRGGAEEVDRHWLEALSERRACAIAARPHRADRLPGVVPGHRPLDAVHGHLLAVGPGGVPGQLQREGRGLDEAEAGGRVRRTRGGGERLAGRARGGGAGGVRREHTEAVARHRPQPADQELAGGGVRLGFGRIVASEIEAPNTLANLV